MISVAAARQMILSLPEVEEKSHFGRPDFRIRNKIFSSLHEDKLCVMVKLNPVDQSVFCAFDPLVIFPVPGGWGRNGATLVNLEKIKKSMLMDALTTAWKTVASPALLKKYFPDQ